MAQYTTLLLVQDFSRLWSKGGLFNKALSKGIRTTTWIWNLHSDAHDFDLTNNIGRFVFSSNLAHIGIVFFWIGGMHFHGAYFSNYGAWLKDPKHCLPSAHLVYSLVGQDILNSDVGGYFQGIYITSGLFHLWRSEGIVTHVGLKYAAGASLIGTRLFVSVALIFTCISLGQVRAFTKNSSLYLFITLASYLVWLL
jgi:photosystem I P700 chlorophyll a apoprotein A1